MEFVHKGTVHHESGLACVSKYLCSVTCAATGIGSSESLLREGFRGAWVAKHRDLSTSQRPHFLISSPWGGYGLKIQIWEDTNIQSPEPTLLGSRPLPST